MSKLETGVFEGSGNVFADLNLPDAEELQLKANLTAALRRLIADRRLTQTKAAQIAGIGQADLSKLLRGSLRGHSVELLMRMLTAFDQDIEIIVRPHAKAGEGGRITFTPAIA
ncbi:helix-turn-helix domain-containing protein [Methylobacterium sp. CM6244]